MNKLLAIGLAAAAVIAVLVVGPNLLPASGTGPGGQPTASATPSDLPSTEPSGAPSSPTPTVTADAVLPEGPFVVRDTGAPAGGPTFTVAISAPGWTAMPDFGGLLKGSSEEPPESAILFWAWPAGSGFNVFGDGCQWESTFPERPYTTVDEIADALAAQESRDASDPVDVTIGGYDGKQVTMHVPDDVAFQDCDQRTFASYGIEENGRGLGGLARTHQGPGQTDELWILDVDGFVVIIDAMYRPDTTDDRIEEMRTIVESTTFQQN